MNPQSLEQKVEQKLKAVAKASGNPDNPEVQKAVQLLIRRQEGEFLRPKDSKLADDLIRRCVFII